MSERLSHPSERRRSVVSQTALIIVLMWAVIAATETAAQSGDDALELEADSIHYDKNTGNSVYQGNVVITQGNMRLTGDEVEVFSTQGEFSRIVAHAKPGTFSSRSQGGRVDAEARRIEYDIRRRIVVFAGDARVDDGEKVLRGERIIYDIDKKIVKATKDKQRVRLTINP